MAEHILLEKKSRFKKEVIGNLINKLLSFLLIMSEQETTKTYCGRFQRKEAIKYM
jgi:hypothetical protein